MYIVRNDQIAILYGTDDCHLCEQAQMALTDAGISFEYIDIAINEVMVAEFGTKIPVILFQGIYIHWPFSITENARLKYIKQGEFTSLTQKIL